MLPCNKDLHQIEKIDAFTRDPRVSMKTHEVEFRDAVRVWWQIGLQSFGGPAGQIALMHRIIVQALVRIASRAFHGALVAEAGLQRGGFSC